MPTFKNSLQARVTAADIADALGGRRSGRGYMVHCPAHDDRNPSLSVADDADDADGKILVKCFAGCTQVAVIEALRARGLWPTPVRAVALSDKSHRGKHKLDGVDDRHSAALQIWDASSPIKGTLGQTYFLSRGIKLELPDSLRFHPELWHSGSRTTWPAVVALATDALTGKPTGIHRTYLDRDGMGKAPVEPTKMMVGTIKGAVVRLAEATDEVMIGEGIETCLSVQQACNKTVWAALSAPGLAAVNLPSGITTVTILADGDRPGATAAFTAALRLKNAVRVVRIVRAPVGTDFNDLLVGASGKERAP